jgi:hypothetical protein
MSTRRDVGRGGLFIVKEAHDVGYTTPLTLTECDLYILLLFRIATDKITNAAVMNQPLGVRADSCQIWFRTHSAHRLPIQHSWRLKPPGTPYKPHHAGEERVVPIVLSSGMRFDPFKNVYRLEPLSKPLSPY